MLRFPSHNKPSFALISTGLYSILLGMLAIFCLASYNNELSAQSIQLRTVSGLGDPEPGQEVTSYWLTSVTAIIEITGAGTVLIKAVPPSCSNLNYLQISSHPQKNPMELRADQTWFLENSRSSNKRYLHLRTTGNPCLSGNDHVPHFMRLTVSFSPESL